MADFWCGIVNVNKKKVIQIHRVEYKNKENMFNLIKNHKLLNKI